jgi:hypothetical protein
LVIIAKILIVSISEINEYISDISVREIVNMLNLFTRR